MSETTWIYGMYCPASKKIRYVGASCSPVTRYRAHFNTSSYGVTAWIRDLANEDLRPELVLLEEVQALSVAGGRHPEVAEAEDRWILKLIDESHPLLNVHIPRRKQEEEEQMMDAALRRGKEMFG